MESNQDGLKALLQEKDCVGVPANEEYQEYLVDYLLDENFFENELADYCVFPIGYNQSIVYITWIIWRYSTVQSDFIV